MFRDKSGDVLYRYVDVKDQIHFGWGKSDNSKSILSFKDNLDLVDIKSRKSKRLLKCINKARALCGIDEIASTIENGGKRARTDDEDDEPGPSQFKKTNDGSKVKAKEKSESSAEPSAISTQKVLEMKTKLQREMKSDNEENIIKLLRFIHERCIISLSQLKQTQLGATILKLHKHSNSDIKLIAKLLLRQWNNEMKAKKKSTTGGKKEQKQGSKAAQPKVLKNVANDQTQEPAPTYIEQNIEKTPPETIHEALKEFQTPENMRNMTLSKLTTVFVNQTFLDLKASINIALNIENELWTFTNGDKKKYSQQYKAIIFNLKQLNNPDFRIKVATEQITPHQVVRMKSKDMASSALQAIRKKATEEAIRKSSAPKMPPAKPGMHRCGKCKSEQVFAYPVQTRSADEPMTLFCTCTICGNNWKQY